MAIYLRKSWLHSIEQAGRSTLLALYLLGTSFSVTRLTEVVVTRRGGTNLMAKVSVLRSIASCECARSWSKNVSRSTLHHLPAELRKNCTLAINQVMRKISKVLFWHSTLLALVGRFWVLWFWFACQFAKFEWRWDWLPLNDRGRTKGILSHRSMSPHF